MNRAAVAQAEYILNKVRDEWLARPGVTGVDLGFKWRQGKMTDQVAIRVHVARKIPLPLLNEAERFPKEVGGVPVDVIEATYGLQRALELESAPIQAALNGYGGLFDPLLLGISIGNRFVTAGTLGAKVIDLDSDEAMILSNWHVLAGSLDAAAGLAIWQPGQVDGGSELQTVAKLSRWVLGPFDAAVARLTGARNIQATTPEGDNIGDAISPKLGMEVWKCGRSTGRTEGLIDGLKMSLPLTYVQAGSRTLRDVVRIVPRPGAPVVEISEGGDSGALWVDEATGKAVGLHFGGEIGAMPEYALAHDIAPVLSYLRVRLPGQPATGVTAGTGGQPPEPPSRASGPVSMWQALLRFLRRVLGL